MRTTEAKTAKFDGISNAAPTGSVEERDIWQEISNFNAAIADSHSHFLLRTRHSFVIVVIRRRSAAKHAVRPRRTSSQVVADMVVADMVAVDMAVADTSAVHPRAQA